MKTLPHAVLIALFTVLVILACPMRANAQAYHVVDKAGILSDSDEAMIAKAISDAENGRNMQVWFVTYLSDGAWDSYYGEEFLSEFGFSESDSILLLVETLDNGTYYCDSYAYGAAGKRISTDNSMSVLTSNGVYANLKMRGSGASIAVGAANAFAKYAEVFDKKVGTVLLVSLAVGLFGGAVGAVIVYTRYKTRLRSPSYPLDKYTDLDLQVKSDSMIGAPIVVRTRRSTSSSSGGHSSGGSSHGGGSGHRGGI